jgi:hypothetical protein
MRIPIGVTKAIDKIITLRAEISVLKDEETQLTDSVKDYMKANDLGQIETSKTLAEFTIREGGAIDPESYYEALDEDFEKFLQTISVRKETNKKSGKLGADYYLSIEDLRNITIPTETPVLSVKPAKKSTGLTGVNQTKKALSA